MKTIEDLRKFLLGEIKAARHLVKDAIKHGDYGDAMVTNIELGTYKFLLDYMDGKCD